LYDPVGVEVFELDHNVGRAWFDEALQADDGCVADGLENGIDWGW
jgi:hypothetical protein